MTEEIDYSPEGKNKIEIDKLHVEVAEMRSRFRRWIGSLGGFLGIITAAVSVIVTTQQWDRATRETALAKNQLATERAKFDAERAKGDRAEAELRKTEAEKIEAETNQRIEKMKIELAAAERQKKEAIAVVEKAKTELAETISDKAKAQQDLNDTRKQNETLQTQLVNATQKLTSGDEKDAALKVVQQNKSLTARLEVESVKIEFQATTDTGSSKGIRRLVEELASAGYSFVRINQVKSVPDFTEVRYYHTEDKALAGKISDLLHAKFNINPARATFIDDPDPPARFIQIAFARAAFVEGKLPTPPPERMWAVQIGFGGNYSSKIKEPVETRLKKIQSVPQGRKLQLKMIERNHEYFLIAGRYPDRESAADLLKQFRDDETELGTAVKGTNFFGHNPLPPPMRIINISETFGPIGE